MRGAMASVPHFLKVLDPRELARSGSSWQGILSLGGFKRVTQLVPDHDASVELSLNFSFDEEGRCRVEGSAHLRTGLVCQRCLRTVEHDVDALIDVLVLKEEIDARNLTPEHDTFVLSGREMSVEELVEDDILLSLPQQVCDHPEKCPHMPALEYPSEEAETKLPASPFSVLDALRRKD